MDKRKFIKTLGKASLAITAAGPVFSAYGDIKKHRKNWLWVRPESELTKNGWKDKLARVKASGFTGIMVEVYNSTWSFFENNHLPIKEDVVSVAAPACHELGLEFHAWMWTMPCNIPAIVKEHPDWYAVNGLAESASVKPAYVGYYKFLCPNNPEVREFITSNINALAKIEDIDGIHLDYVRLPDVILAEALQPKYNIVQDREYPQYDYCYSDVCRKLFKEETGVDPLKDLKDPSADLAWRQFRYDSITNLVNNRLVPAAKKFNKKISAAVFPNWQSVRQQWHNWNLDAFHPMLYNNFYNEDVDWIGEQTRIAVDSVKNNAPVYSGVFIPDLSSDQLKKAYKGIILAGGNGITLFDLGAMNEEHWKVVSALN